MPKVKELSVYSCGPTVYNEATLGNWRTFLMYDFLVRALRFGGQEVVWGMNYTDVGHLTSDADTGEDKIAKQAKLERKSAIEVANENIKKFEIDMKKLNIQNPDKIYRATDCVEEMKKLIEQLAEKEFTYQTSDGIYFNTKQFNKYGELSNLDLAGIKEGARVEKNEEKKNATDFALWKFSPKGEKRDMEWENPLGIEGKGFPGWHIECSVMAMKLTSGKTVNLHLGGIDLLSPHHQNELAQSEAATGKKFVDIWMHIEHLLVDGKRMGKSQGNAYTLQDLKKKNFSPLDYRYLICQTHYRKKQNFTWQALEAAKSGRKKLEEILAADKSEGKGEINKAVVQKIKEEVASDLNLPKALAALHEYLNNEVCEANKVKTIKYLNNELFAFLN